MIFLLFQHLFQLSSEDDGDSDTDLSSLQSRQCSMPKETKGLKPRKRCQLQMTIADPVEEKFVMLIGTKLE